LVFFYLPFLLTHTNDQNKKKWQSITSVGKDVKKLHTFLRDCRLEQPLQKFLKIWKAVITWHDNSIPKFISKRTEIMYLQKNFYSKFHTNIIYTSQITETIQMLIKW
jgi:hypothetical protein